MIIERKAYERGEVQMDWLHSFHSFSFASYFDPKWMGFSRLRVINEDRIEPEQGFGSHPHRDMEIITFMLEGELEHRDNLGGHEVIKTGEIQVMSAGTGVVHSEFNAHPTQRCHLLQIWIEPNIKGVKPNYSQFFVKTKPNQLNLIVDNQGGEDIAKINQEAKIFDFHGTQNLDHPLDEKKKYWIQVYAGSAKANGHDLSAGDALAFMDETRLELNVSSEIKFLFFELP